MRTKIIVLATLVLSTAALAPMRFRTILIDGALSMAAAAVVVGLTAAF